MQYMVSGKTFEYSYQELKALYEKYCALDDYQFMLQINKIIHFACFVSYIKELKREETLGDEGIVHQLVHLIAESDPANELKSIREQFEKLLKLS